MNRIYLKQMLQYDLDTGSSRTRLLEMHVDAYPRGIVLQFWKDVNLYGLDEAIKYLRNTVGVTPKIEQLSQETLEKIRMKYNPDSHSSVIRNLKAGFFQRFNRELTLPDERIFQVWNEWCTCESDDPDDPELPIFDALNEVTGG